MNSFRVIYHLARADYLERTRRSGFLIVAGLTVVAGYFYLPANSATTKTLAITLDFGGYRGVYNSAWVGIQVVLFASLWLSLVGFYLVKNTVERDVRTGVGQILAATSLRKVQYTLGKTLSNFTLLATIVGILTIAAGVMQLVRGEDTHLHPWTLLSPFVFIMLPTMAVIGAVAVFFETVAWLSKTFGNVVYFLLISSIITVTQAISISPAMDLLGSTFPLQQMQQGVKAAVPGYNGTFNYGTRFGTAYYHTFQWGGIQWTGELVLSRLLWLGVAFAIAVLAALFFPRFDPVDTGQKLAIKLVPQQLFSSLDRDIPVHVPAQVHLTPLSGQRDRWRWIAMLVSETRLLLKGVVWWWFAGATALVALCLLLPFDVARGSLFPIVWLWTLPLWSSLGNREARHRTTQLVFSTAHPLRHQLPMQWLAGVTIALLTASGMIAHNLLLSSWSNVLALSIGATFVPALALAAGIWTGNSRLFEVVFVVLWYIGAINHLPALDFMGTTDATIAMHIPLLYGIVATVLLFLAFVGRRRQLQR